MTTCVPRGALAGERSRADRALRVGLNLLFLGERAGGIGRYARELPGALLEADPRTEIEVYVSREAPRSLWSEPWASRVRIRRLPVTATPPLPYLVVQYLVLPALAAASRLEVLHSPANVGPVLTPATAGVVTLTDVIWALHAPEWEDHPGAGRALNRQVRHAIRHADRILAISHAAAAAIAESLGVDSKRITVSRLGIRSPTGPPPSAHRVRERLGLGDSRVVLCVAQKRRYKNLHSLVAAHAQLPGDVVLVLPGSPTSYEQDLRAQADKLRTAERVRFPGWVDEQDLEALYATASVFVLPSVVEGFGLPVLEAMVRGVAVACSQIPALQEVAGDAAMLFDPARPDAIAQALRHLLENPDLRRRLAAAGRKRAANFSWRSTGEATLAGYRDAIAARRGDRLT